MDMCGGLTDTFDEMVSEDTTGSTLKDLITEMYAEAAAAAAARTLDDDDDLALFDCSGFRDFA